MIDHIIFIFYIIFISISTIGYGYLFSLMFNKKLLSLNLGYQGLFGFFFLIIISSITTFFFKHHYFHNLVVHLIGIFTFIYFLKNFQKKDIRLSIILFILLFISIYVYKNHDDFPYYHLTYTLNLVENKFIIGSGNFGHGFRTFSSLFFFHSLVYLPLIKFYIFHIGPFLILFFSNFILIKILLKSLDNKSFKLKYFFSLFSLTFINIAFYRISEHGTDRSAQILIFLIFVYLIDLLTSKDQFNKKNLKFEIMLIFIFLAASMKAIYFIYIIIIPLIFYKVMNFKLYLSKLNKGFFFIISVGIFMNILINFLSTGCLLYPAKKTCFATTWSIPKKEVANMSIHYEWWSKAGGGPKYKHDLKKIDYIKNFNWFKNWVDRHFFNKVSDTLLGILFISFIYIILFKILSINKDNKFYLKNLNILFLLIGFLFLEWFVNHPAMRYGGYVLIALPIFLLSSTLLSKYNYNFNKLKKSTFILMFLIITIFISRNFIRLQKEINLYNYNIAQSPLFYIQNIKSNKILTKDNFNIYAPQNNKMCWASKTPCSYRSDLDYINVYNFKIVIRK